MDVPEEGSVAEFLRAGAKKAAPVDEKPVLLHRKADADVERKLDAATGDVGLIRLASCHVRARGAAALARALRRARCLHDLELTSCELPEAGAVALGHAARASAAPR